MSNAYDGSWAKTFDTRIDRARARLGMSPNAWAKEAHMSRNQLMRYRTGEDEPRSNTLANLVRAARRLTAKPVRASDFYDLGESEPLGERVERKQRSAIASTFPTRLDRLLVREGVVPTRLADESKVARQVLGRLRAGRGFPRVATVAAIVRTLRRMGIDVRANDIVDVGDYD